VYRLHLIVFLLFFNVTFSGSCLLYGGEQPYILAINFELPFLALAMPGDTLDPRLRYGTGFRGQDAVRLAASALVIADRLLLSLILSGAFWRASDRRGLCGKSFATNCAYRETLFHFLSPMGSYISVVFLGLFPLVLNSTDQVKNSFDRFGGFWATYQFDLLTS
jgi:hypothetical protein